MRLWRKVRTTSSPDYVFLGALALLVIFGFVMLASASADVAKITYNDGYYFLKQQVLKGLIPGMAGLLIGFLVCYRRWERVALTFFVLSVVALLLVFTPLGEERGGATRWLGLGDISFQPSEILKIAFVIYLASWMSRGTRRSMSFVEGFVPFVLLAGAIGFILFKQPSTTNAVLLFATALVMYFASGAKLRFLFGFVTLGVVLVAGVVYMTPYRLERVMTFLHPEQTDVLEEGYHIQQALIAVGSGGVTGVGYGKSTAKLYSLPEPIGDSIFAVIGEELGFVGAVGLVVLFFVLVWRGFMIANRSPDMFGKLLVMGLTSLIGLQVFVNIGAVSGLLPLTGVPLPFVSFGGTAMAVFLTMGGVILNVSRYRR
jgi:cell division protein FtsW